MYIYGNNSIAKSWKTSLRIKPIQFGIAKFSKITAFLFNLKENNFFVYSQLQWSLRQTTHEERSSVTTMKLASKDAWAGTERDRRLLGSKYRAALNCSYEYRSKRSVQDTPLARPTAQARADSERRIPLAARRGCRGQRWLCRFSSYRGICDPAIADERWQRSARARPGDSFATTASAGCSTGPGRRCWGDSRQGA